MGFLSNLFRGRSQDDWDEDDDDEVESESDSDSDSTPDKDTKPIRLPKLVTGMSLDVSLAENGEPLLFGEITSISSRSVTLERQTGQLAFPLREPGTKVALRGYGTDGIPFDVSGVVTESTRLKMAIKELKPIAHNENRTNFRVFINKPITMYYDEDRDLENPEQCTLINISTGGACVQSEFIHGEGEVLRLRIHIDPYAPITFRGEVIRVDEPKPNLFRYGILFAKLPEHETSVLTRMLFNIQVGENSKKTAAQSGRR